LQSFADRSPVGFCAVLCFGGIAWVVFVFGWGGLKILPGLPRGPSQKDFETSSVSQHSDGPVGLSNLLWLGTWLLRWRRTTVLFPCLIPVVTLGRDLVDAVAAVNSPFFPCLILGNSLV
jgi:hypothetical protein